MVRYRTAWALGTALEFPVWLICGFLVPLALLPDWVRPDRVAAAADLGGGGDARCGRSAGRRGSTSLALPRAVGARLRRCSAPALAERLLDSARGNATLALT